MDLQLALEQRAKVEEFQRKHRIGLLTLLFTDLVGSTKLKQELGDREAVALIQRYRGLVRDILSRFKEGEEIETAGDSFFIVFAKPSDAVQFSLMLQSKLRALAGEIARPLLNRIGLHIGEVVIEERPNSPKPKDLYGLQVDICARVMSLAEGDQILMTRSAFDNARQVLKGQDSEAVGSLSWLNHGPYLLKGVEEPMEICEVGEVGAAVLKPPADSDKVHRYVSPDAEPVLGWRPALGQQVPGTQWILEEKLGEGGFGEVWLGRHSTTKERRVFKFCFRADRVRALKREVTLFRLLKERVGEHPNVVRLLDVYFEEPPYYLEMEYVAGRDLKTWSEAPGRDGMLPSQTSATTTRDPSKNEHGWIDHIPLATRLEIVAQVADALQAAHDAGVIHRDVKPSNILVESRESRVESQNGNAERVTSRRSTLDARPTVKLTDFGIGQVVSEEVLASVTRAGFTQTMLGSTSSQTGTQLYMAPELLAGKPATTRSDIYSLGVVLYQLIVGDFTRPVTADWAYDISDPLLREHLKQCFAGHPSARFAGAGQLARNLRAPASPLRRASSWSLQHPWILTSVSSVLLLAVVGLAYGLWVFFKKERRRVFVLESRTLLQSSRVGDPAASTNYLKGMVFLEKASRLQPGRDLIHEAMGWMALGENADKRIPHRHGGAPGGTNVLSVDLSRDGRLLAASFDDGAVEIYQTSNGSVVYQRPKAPGSKRLMALSADGRWLATAEAGRRPGVVEVWDWQTTQAPTVLQSHDGDVTALAFSPDGQYVASAGRGDQATLRSPEVKLLDLFTKTLQQTLTPFRRNSDQHSMRGVPYYYEEKIDRLIFNHQGFGLAAISEKHTIRFSILTNILSAATNTLLLEHFPVSASGDWVAFDLDSLQIALYGVGNHGLFKKFHDKNAFYVSQWRGEATGPSHFTQDGKQIVDFHPTHGHSWWRYVRSLRSETRTSDTPSDTPVPGKALAMRPDGTALTLDREGRSFLFWRSDHIRDELRKFGLTECLPPWIGGRFRDRITKEKDPLLRPVLINLPRLLMAGVLVFICLCGVGGFFVQQTKGLRFVEMFDSFRVQNTPSRHQLHPFVLGTIMGLGLLGLVFGFHMLLKTVDAFIWERFISAETVFFSCALIWIGSMLGWQSARNRWFSTRGPALIEPEQLLGDEFNRITTALYAGDKGQAVDTYRTACQVGRAEARAVIEDFVRKLYKRHPERFSTNPSAALEWDLSRLTLMLVFQLAILIGIYEVAKPNWDAHLIAELIRAWFLGFAINALRVFVSRWGAVRSWLIVFASVMVMTVTSVMIEQQFTDRLKRVEQPNKFVVVMVGIAAGTILGQYSIKRK